MIKSIYKLIRVKQWVKNAFVLAPLLFSLKFLEIASIESAFVCFFVFCFVSSIVYILNDIVDRKKDAQHPTKKFRPIASGKISVKMALCIAVLLVLGAVFGLLYLQNDKIIITIALYLLINIFYSLKLKNIAIIDVFMIALGFVLRVYAGAYAIGVPVSSYIFMTTLFLSLFLGFTKRKMELLHCGSTARKVLQNYSNDMVNQYIIISIALTIMCYALYTLEPSTILHFGTNRLIYSVIFVIYGMFRYLYILDKHKDVEDPTENVLKDKGLIGACMLWAIYVLLLLAKVI